MTVLGLVNEVNLMTKYYPTFFILCSFFIYSNAQAQSPFDLLAGGLAAGVESEKKRKAEAPKLAPGFILRAKHHSHLGSYLIEQLRIQSEDPETNRKKVKKIRIDIKRIEKDLRRLDLGISEWEVGDYSKKLDKLTATFSSKHIKRHKNIVEVEQERIAAAERAEQERIAAELKAYQLRCEPADISDDPFASFNATAVEPKIDLVLNIGRSKMKLQATKNGSCMWLGNADRNDIKPALLIENSYQQNPNNKTQYSLKITSGAGGSAIYSITPKMRFGISTIGRFVLDFENYRCALIKDDGSQIKIDCSDGMPINLSDVSDIINEDCKVVSDIFRRNRIAFLKEFKTNGTLKLADCNIPQ